MKSGLLTFLLVCALTCSGLLSAQTLKGRVVSKSGELLPFAKVELLVNEKRTRTEINGEFTLEIENLIAIEDSLIVTIMGYTRYSQAININENKTFINVVLNEKPKELDEVVVTALKYYKPEQLVKNSIKKAKENYSGAYCNGFYREQIKEEENWILLNEAWLKIIYGNYPQKNYANKSFRNYYDKDYLPWDTRKHSVFTHLVYFPNYISSTNDKVSIYETRSSVDYSKFETFSTPIGSTFDLLALDKIKYQSDFLDPKLMDQYTYLNYGQKIIDGKKCYIVKFHPKSDSLISIFQGFNNKPKFPIYTGLLYISSIDFTVLKIEYEFAENLDYSIYTYFNGKIGPPKDVRVTVDYGVFENKYILKSVETYQTKDYTTDINNSNHVQYECIRTLKLGEYSHNGNTILEENLNYLTKSFHINKFSKHYTDSLWNTVEKSDLYTPIQSEIKESLEKYLPLSDQFRSVNINIEQIQAPIAPIDSTFIYIHKDTVQDFYGWLERQEDSLVVDYIKRENRYSESILESISGRSVNGFQNRMNNLFQEIYKSPDIEKENSVNEVKENNGFQFKFGKTSVGDIFIIKINDDQTSDSVLNLSNFAKEKVNFVLEEVRFSDKELLAISNSVKGGYSKTLSVFDDTNLKLISIDSTDGFRWLNDSSIVYVKQNKQLRNFQIRIININSKLDTLIYEETNSSYIVHISDDESKNYIIIESRGLSDNKIQLIKIKGKDFNPSLVFENKKNQFGDIISDKNGRIYLSVNTPQNNSNLFPLMEGEYLGESIYHTNQIIDNVVLTKNYIVLTEFWLNRYKITVIDRDNFKIQKLFEVDSIQYVSIVDHKFDNNSITLIVSSPTTPFKQFELDLTANQLVLKHHIALRNQITNVEMKNVPGKDGTLIPVMVLSNSSISKDSIKGVILRAYGAYGYPEPPRFNDIDQVFVEMGYVVAYSFVRGGGELGIDWHLSGRKENKINSFTDYIACATYLKEYYNVDKSKMVGISSSAGGLIMGYVANNSSDIFGTLIFDRPFLDPLSMMLDNKSTLTEVEYDEWGNPAFENEYKIIRSYSPYQNILSKDYPNMLFLGGYYDDQAPYWQVVKSAVAYRRNNLSNSVILLSMDMESGHKGRGGSSRSLNNQRIVKFILNSTGNEN